MNKFIYAYIATIAGTFSGAHGLFHYSFIESVCFTGFWIASLTTLFMIVEIIKYDPR